MEGLFRISEPDPRIVEMILQQNRDKTDVPAGDKGKL